MSAWELDLLDARSREVEPAWRNLERVALPAYFLTWGWVENWLALLPVAGAPKLALFRRDGEPVAGCFVGKHRVLRHGFGLCRELFLNATGCPAWDQLCIEHNAVLCASEAESLAELVAALPGDWDELALPALSRSAFPGSALAQPLPHFRLRIEREEPAPFVDLARVRASRTGYPGLLGSGTRAQIRRAQRDFGELSVEVAADLRHAFDIYDELVALHQDHWQRRGQPGAFANTFFDAFHRRLITNRLADREIQLVRVRAKGTTIGCLYNLVSRGRVLFYQSGFPQFESPRAKAGYVVHAEAIRLNAAAGHSVYDLLAGEDRYKQNLATDTSPLVWARIQRPLMRFTAEDRLRSWKHRLSRIVAAAISQ